MSPLQQVLGQAQQFRSHPLSGREGRELPHCCVPTVSSLLLDNKMQSVSVCLFCPKAVRCSMYGRPGACYVDIAGDMVNAKVDRSKVRSEDFIFFFCIICHVFRCVLSLTRVCLCSREVSCCPPPPLSAADTRAITDALSVLSAAKRPLIIIGKGDKIFSGTQKCKF